MARRIEIVDDCPEDCPHRSSIWAHEHRRVLDPGSYVLIEKVDGEWQVPIRLGLHGSDGAPVDVGLMFDTIADTQTRGPCPRCGGKGYGSYVVEGWAGNDVAYVDCGCRDALAGGEQP